MKDDMLIKAVKEDSDKLGEVLKASYSLKPLSELELLTIAKETNKKLGYELFKDLDYESIVYNFTIVSRVVAKNAIKNNN